MTKNDEAYLWDDQSREKQKQALWTQLSAVQRMEFADRLPKTILEKLTFPELGKIYDAARAAIAKAETP